MTSLDPFNKGESQIVSLVQLILVRNHYILTNLFGFRNTVSPEVSVEDVRLPELP